MCVAAVAQTCSSVLQEELVSYSSHCSCVGSKAESTFTVGRKLCALLMLKKDKSGNVQLWYLVCNLKAKIIGCLLHDEAFSMKYLHVYIKLTLHLSFY